MTPEAERYLDKARRLLTEARAIVGLGLGDVAGRMACLAAFHAAQALIFERLARAPKTHRGVHAQFAGLVRDEPNFDVELRSFLSRAYALKSVADYETGPEADIPVDVANEALSTASRFIVAIAALLEPDR